MRIPILLLSVQPGACPTNSNQLKIVPFELYRGRFVFEWRRLLCCGSQCELSVQQRVHSFTGAQCQFSLARSAPPSLGTGEIVGTLSVKYARYRHERNFRSNMIAKNEVQLQYVGM